MEFHGVRGDVKFGRNLAVAKAARQCLKQRPFALGQLMDRIRLKVAHIEEWEHHLARRNRRAGFEQSIDGPIARRESSSACAKRVTWQISAGVAVDDDARRIRLFSQNLDQFLTAEFGEFPIDNADLDRHPHHGSKEALGCGCGCHQRESWVAVKNLGHG